MKKISIKLSFIALAVFSMTFFPSCESNEVNEQNNGQGNTSSSLRNYVRAVANDNSEGLSDLDLDWDDMSCDGVVVFTFDGTDMTFTAATESDIQAVIDQLNQDTGSDYMIDDILVISVLITDDNGNEIELDEEEDIIDYFDDCIFSGDPDDGDGMMDCVDIQYPITSHIYDTVSNDSATVTIENDDQLMDVVDNLTDNQLIEFDYPITLIFDDGNTIDVNNEDELIDLLEEAYEMCGEGDLDDWDDDMDDDDMDDDDMDDDDMDDDDMDDDTNGNN